MKESTTYQGETFENKPMFFTANTFYDYVKNELASCMKEKSLVSFYSNTTDTEKFSVGFVRAISDEFVLLAHVTTTGYYDGFLLKTLESIFEIKHSGKYEKKLADLYRLQKQNHPDISISYDSLSISILTHALEKGLIISLGLFNSGLDDIQGYVMEICDDFLKIELIDDYGENDGIATLNICDITHVVCDSENEIALNLLSREDSVKS